MILVSGANGVVGHPLCQKLADKGLAYRPVSRACAGDEDCLQWDMHETLTAAQLSQLDGISTVIHCAPLWLLPEHLPQLKQAGMQRLIAFSSSSVTGKLESADPQEQLLVKQLSDAEQAIRGFCDSENIAWTIFRPSMIYGHGRDQNISHLAGFIRRFGFVVVAGKGTGLRQPVHADDLAIACLFCLDNRRSHAQIYTLAGADQLSYREMLKRIFTGLDKKPRIVSLPTSLVRLALRILATLSSFSYTAEMADRMNRDLVYDYQPATRDFGFMPRKFLADPGTDLGVEG